ncbi:MAG TPA: DUF748 domain-containing protein, partial [Candidatus Limnocylindrales bacterium]|nr:DUF748 domain-containing protein [Candidatus Limnocylindrales bacterium]
VKAEVLTPPGPGAPVPIAIELDAARAEPLVASGRVTVSRLDLTSLLPYVKAELPAALTRGVLAVDIAMAMEEGETEMARATVSGSIHVTDLAVTQKDAVAPFFTAPRMSLRVKQADAMTNTVTVTAAELEGARLRLVRDAQGNVDLLALRSSLPPPPPPAPPAPPGTIVIPRRLIATAITKALTAPWSLTLDRLAVTKGGVTFEDRALSPPVVLPVDDIEVIGQRLTWPAKGPAVVTLRAAMPGGGHTEVKVTGIPEPLDIQLTSVTRDAPIAPYARYFPFAARFEGRFNGDSLNEVKQDGDVLRAASRGTAWATDIQVVDPQSPTPLVRLERLEIRDIDFSWPNYALVPKITLTKPEIRVERDPDGVFNLRRAFEPRDKPAPDGPAAPAAPPSPPPSTPAPTATAAEPDADTPKKPALLETIVLDFSEIVLEEGFIRFLDRTTTPAFSQDMSQLRVEIRDLSNVLGRKRTTMPAKATVGGDAALDLRGELSGIGETLRADLVGEIRDFQLASANPYADSLTSWIVERGKLQAKVHYRVEGDRITAEHDVNVGGLKVAKTEGADEAKKRLGLPLGLIVGLLKDSRGNIDFNLPLQGSLSDRSFDWGEAMWAGVKQTLLKVLAAPFRAIGRLFTGGGDDKDKIEEVRIEPLRFPPGSSVIGPATEQQLTHVAEFLRRSPFVGLSLAPVATAPDVENLRLQALTARITKLQEDKKLPDFPAAVTAYYAEQKIEGPPPKTTEERMAILIKREPDPDAGAIAALLERRVTTTREAFTRLEGIPAARLVPGPPRQLPAEAAEGRVEFSLVAE